MTAREQFRRDTLDVLTLWHMNCIPPRLGNEAAMFREGIADVLALRLRLAYMPLFEGLERITARVGVLADLRAEPYAPPPADKIKMQIRTR